MSFRYCIFPKNTFPIACEGDDSNDSFLIQIKSSSEIDSYTKIQNLYPNHYFIKW